jgi:hypothetical protein
VAEGPIATASKRTSAILAARTSDEKPYTVFNIAEVAQSADVPTLETWGRWQIHAREPEMD